MKKPVKAVRFGPTSFRITRADAVRYAGASTDFNPIHWSERMAKQLGLPGVIAHGLFTMGLTGKVVTDWLGDPGKLKSYKCRFANPVVLPDDDEGTEVKLIGKVTKRDDPYWTIHLEVTVNGGRVLSRVDLEVEPPEHLLALAAEADDQA
jgi:acyl dehydratase